MRRRMRNTYLRLKAIRRRILKTISYRVSASVIAQIACWIIFRNVQINVATLILDLIQMVWYYLHEGFWNRQKTKEA